MINQDHKYSLENVLFVFALESEAADVFEGRNIMFTGIGKINAACKLTKAIHQNRPNLIINLGSAGSSQFQRGEVVCCNQFVQRDMDVRGLGYELYETPFSGIPSIFDYGLIMENLPSGICGTGDNFEMGHTITSYSVVDMEAYALALVAMQESIPFLCLKYISDGADDNAAADWTEQVHKAAAAFGKILNLL